MHVTVDEAADLVRKTRRTLYRYMNAGALSYTVGADERRRIDTSELIRVFGPFPKVTETEKNTVTETMSQSVTAIEKLAIELEALRKTVERSAVENELLRKEIFSLKEALYLLEYKPAKQSPALSSIADEFADFFKSKKTG